MFISDNEVIFTKSDMNFVSKFGIEEAADMVLEYKSRNKLPFIYDTHQLASFFMLKRRDLFRVSRNCNDMYRLITIKKKNGNDRIINAPNNFLKTIQFLILCNILRKFSISKYATAYHKGATLLKNASPHCNKKYLLKLDLSDFFSSITFMQVYSSAFNTHYFPKQIGVMLTELCCLDDVLPQGAPTSPALSNIVMKSFDDTIGDWAKNNGISYTRYCDDITFSSDKPLYKAYIKAKSMLEKRGFTLNEKKTHFVTNASRQTVTGLTVNETPKVSREYKRKLRQEIYFALKNGIQDCIEYTKKDITPISYINMLLGKTSFILQVEPENAYFSHAKEKLEKVYDIYNIKSNFQNPFPINI